MAKSLTVHVVFAANWVPSRGRAWPEKSENAQLCLANLERCCKTNIDSPKSVSIQPRTSHMLSNICYTLVNLVFAGEWIPRRGRGGRLRKAGRARAATRSGASASGRESAAPPLRISEAEKKETQVDKSRDQTTF